jgi:hypothetical protein
VNRAPEAAFLGIPQAQQSLRITRAEAAIATTPSGAEVGTLKLLGTVTVFEAFSVFTQQIQIRLGEKTVSFKPNARGTAKSGENTFQVRNGTKFGVVYGGLMEFDAQLRGPEWAAELKKLGVTSDAASTSDVHANIRIDVGEAQHTATVPITRLGK